MKKILLAALIAAALVVPVMCAQPTVRADAGGSYVYVDGKQSGQVCGAVGLFYGDNFHSHNCFDAFEGVTLKRGADGGWLIYQPISGTPSGGSIILERICYEEYYGWLSAENPDKSLKHPPPWPQCPCEVSRRYQIFNAFAENVGQADSIDGPLFPVVRYVHFEPPPEVRWTPTATMTPSRSPTAPPPTLTASPAPSQPTATPSSTFSPPPSPTATSAPFPGPSPTTGGSGGRGGCAGPLATIPAAAAAAVLVARRRSKRLRDPLLK